VSADKVAAHEVGRKLLLHPTVSDAMEAAWVKSPTLRESIQALWAEYDLLCNHDSEDECHTRACPAWRPRDFCPSCGVRHRGYGSRVER
jgi:hypothetical protein